MNIEEKVKELISDELCAAIEDVSGDASLIKDLGADSLDVIEMIMNVESEFDIEISDEDAEKLETVQNVIDYVTEKTS